MKYIFKLICIVLTLVSHALLAQEESEYAITIDDSLDNKWEKFVPSSIRIGVDVAGLAYNFIDPSRITYGAAADIDFHIYSAVFEYGMAQYDHSGDSASYQSKGSYYRVGLDANFLNKDKSLNMFFFGLRFAHSKYDDSIEGIVKEAGWGYSEISRTQSNSKANWAELVIGVRLRVWKSLFMGYTTSLKVKKAVTTDNLITPYYIPGYGVSARKSNIGFNYYIYYKFAWKKKKIPKSKE